MQDLSMQYFAGALRTSVNRLIFWDPELTCSNEIVEILKTNKDLQLQYHTLLVIWLLTFENKIARELNKYHHLKYLANLGNMILSQLLSKYPKPLSRRK
jgi:V-type H+-transporting ATPase subunit H